MNPKLATATGCPAVYPGGACSTTINYSSQVGDVVEIYVTAMGQTTLLACGGASFSSPTGPWLMDGVTYTFSAYKSTVKSKLYPTNPYCHDAVPVGKPMAPPLTVQGYYPYNDGDGGGYGGDGGDGGSGDGGGA